MNMKGTSPSGRILLYSTLLLSCAGLLLLATHPVQASEANAPDAYAAQDIQFCPKGKA